LPPIRPKPALNKKVAVTNRPLIVPPFLPQNIEHREDGDP
jgi:hypothetical protein